MVFTTFFIRFFVFCETPQNESSLGLKKLPEMLPEITLKSREDQQVLNSVYDAMKNNVQVKLGNLNYLNDNGRNQRNTNYIDNADELNINEILMRNQNQVIERKSDNHAKGYRYNKDTDRSDYGHRHTHHGHGHGHHHYEEE